MRVSKEKSTENREALIKAASKLFREKGIDGVGVAEISKAAGLTHGALYAHFSSKEAIAAEAFSHGFRHSMTAMRACAGGKEPPGLDDYLDFLLSVEMRDSMADRCPLAASASEIARQDHSISSRFADSFQEMASAVAASLAATDDATRRRDLSFAIIAAQIGAIAVARATMKSNPALSDEVLKSMRRVLGDAAVDGSASES